MASEGLPDWQRKLLQQHKLDPSYIASAQYWFDPMAEAIVSHQKAVGRPLLIGVNGSQGSGKSTLCAYLELAITSKFQLRVVTLSLDDFYYPRERRLQLGEEVHPLLATRGVPGTHDMALLGATLNALLDPEGESVVAIPRFDKASDDRCPEPESVLAPVDLVLLEGWCLGASPQSVAELREPVNTLERDEDAHGVWRNYVNGVLARYFVPLYQRIDRWVMLQAPDFESVFQWRLEQEEKLAASAAGRSGRRVMNEQQVAHFIQLYERLTRAALAQLPRMVDHLYVLDEARRIKSAEQFPQLTP